MSDQALELQRIKELFAGETAWVHNDDIYVVQKLMFHYALLINPDPSGCGYEQRYCYKDLDLIKLAGSELIRNGKLRYWHKDHTKNLSAHNNLLFPQGVHYEDPSQAIAKVNWSTEHLRLPHITCPSCDKTSFSEGDIDNEYCKYCGYHSEILREQLND